LELKKGGGLGGGGLGGGGRKNIKIKVIASKLPPK